MINVIDNTSGVDKFDPIVNLAILKASSDEVEAIELVEKAREIALNFGDTTKIIRSSRMLGQLLNRQERPNEAVVVLVSIVDIAKRSSLRDEYKKVLNNLAVGYTLQAQYDKALEVNFKTLLLREEDNDKIGVTSSLNNIGLVYYKLKNFENALTFYNKALAIKQEIGDEYDLERLLMNIGLCYNELGNYDKSHDYFEKGFDACRAKCTPQIQIEGDYGLGVSYFGLHNYDEAESYFNKSYLTAKAVENQRFQAENLLHLAQIKVIRGETTESIKLMLECEKLSRTGGYKQILIETFKNFSDLYRKSNDFENASYYQNQYIQLRDSILNESLIKNIAKIQSNYEERENIAIIATKEEVIQRQRSLNIAIAIIAVLACLLIFVLYQSNKVKKRVNQALSDAKDFIELKNIELDKKVSEKTADLEVANDSLSKVNEELDNFIYKTSHDIRGPLASLKGICNVALMDVKDSVALSYLEKLDVTAENLNTILTRLLIINQINNSVVKPEPINFDYIIEEVLLLEKKRGLPAGLQVRKFIQEDVDFYCDREFVRIILENLIDNAIKFYNDSARVEPFVEIRVEEENREMRIRVIDNGIGISEAKPDKIFQMFSRASERSSTGGIGLYITKTATEKIGGQVGLRTTPEGYTEFYVKFMLDAYPAPTDFGL